MKIERFNNYEIKCIVGAPGIGKSSVAQWIVLENIKRNIPVWSNMCLSGAYIIDIDDFMKVDFVTFNSEGEKIRGGVLLLDESGIDFNGRNWKNFSNNFVKFFKLHRHFKLDIYVFSQANDMDITIRRLAQKWYKIVRPNIPFLKYYYAQLLPINSDLVIEHGDWKLSYEVDKNIFASHLIPVYKTWKYFDSYEVPNLPTKQFKKWSEIEEIPKKKRLNILNFKELFKTKEEKEIEIDNNIEKYSKMNKEDLFEELNNGDD